MTTFKNLLTNRFGAARSVMVFFIYYAFKDGQGRTLELRSFHLKIQGQKIATFGVGMPY